MRKIMGVAAVLALVGLVPPVLAQPGGKGPKGDGEIKKLEAQIKQLQEQVKALQEQIGKGKDGFGKFEGKGKEDFKKFWEGKMGDKDWGKKWEEMKKEFEGKDFGKGGFGKDGFGKGFGPMGKWGEWKKPGEGKKATTDELLQQILTELKAIRKEKEGGKGGFGKGFPGDGKGGFGKGFPGGKKFDGKGPGGGDFFKSFGKDKGKDDAKPAPSKDSGASANTDQILRQILDELKAMKKESGGKK